MKYTLLLTPMEGDDLFIVRSNTCFECASGNILEEQIDIFKSEFINIYVSVNQGCDEVELLSL